MSRFSFGKRTADDEGIPPEPIDGETEVGALSDVVEGSSRMRRPLIFAVIGVLLIGGAYLANLLFFSAPPPPPIPTRPTIPAPVAAPPAPPVQTKEAPAGPPSALPSKTEAKGDTKGTAPVTPAPAKAPTPAKAAPEPVAPAKTGPPATPAPASKAAPAPASKAAPAPMAKAERQAPAKGVASTAKGFSVQVAAMAQEANAENLKRKLDAMGFQAVVRKASGVRTASGAANSHVVTVGEPTGKQEAEDLARRLNVDGFPSQVLVVGDKYAPQVGSFVILDEAIDLARELQKKNYRPKITSKPATTALYQVRHGQFDTRADAMKRSEELKAKGFSAWVVPN